MLTVGYIVEHDAIYLLYGEPSMFHCFWAHHINANDNISKILHLTYPASQVLFTYQDNIF